MLRMKSLLLLCALVVSGCDQGDEKNITKATRNTETSIYFKEKVGMDFGVRPLSIKKERKQYGRDNKYSYELSGSLRDVEQRITSIMTQMGNKKVIRSSTKNSMSVVYLSQNKVLVAMRYRQAVRDGLKRKVLLTVSWRS